MPDDRKTRILIIDDDVGFRDLLRIHLSAAGYQVQLAEDGVTGGRALLAQTPDLIVSDLNMPYLNGFELLSLLHSDAETAVDSGDTAFRPQRWRHHGQGGGTGRRGFPDQTGNARPAAGIDRGLLEQNQRSAPVNAGLRFDPAGLRRGPSTAPIPSRSFPLPDTPAAFSSRSARRRILPTLVLGRSVPELDVLRALVAGQVLVAVRAQLPSPTAPGPSCTTNSLTASLECSSGTPTAAHSSTPGSIIDHAFDLVRIDVEAGHQDHVFLAVDDARVALLVHDADVAAAKVAVRSHDLRRLLRALPVAGHHLRPADADLACLAQRQFVAGVVADRDFGGRHRQPDRAGELLQRPAGWW